jgi:hypothetical protein
MLPTPKLIRGLQVLDYSPIDQRHIFTGNNERRVAKEWNDEQLVGAAAGLAICRKKRKSVVLFGCDRLWRPIWSVECATLEVAKSQAEFEYARVSQTWIEATTEPCHQLPWLASKWLEENGWGEEV